MRFLDLLLGSGAPTGPFAPEGWALCAQTRSLSVRCATPMAPPEPEALGDLRLERLRRLGWSTVGGRRGDGDRTAA